MEEVRLARGISTHAASRQRAIYLILIGSDKEVAFLHATARFRYEIYRGRTPSYFTYVFSTIYVNGARKTLTGKRNMTLYGIAATAPNPAPNGSDARIGLLSSLKGPFLAMSPHRSRSLVEMQPSLSKRRIS